MKDKPKQIAALYSGARLQTARYWDFCASRNQVRGRFRSRLVREAHEFEPPQADPRPPSAPAAGIPIEATKQVEHHDVANRWYALRSVFAAPHEPPQPGDRQPPILAFFSWAGGVGKTCLVATLGRALAALGEHVLLADTSACGMLPFYFGSGTSRPGAVRTFFRPGFGAEAGAPVQVVNLPAEHFPSEASGQDSWLHELMHSGRSATRILLDVGTASQLVTRRWQLLKPTVLVPVLPDMSSVACLGLIESLPAPEETVYLLNQFDAQSPLHVDVRNLLQQRLGDRLLPFVLRRSPLVSEALAEGMTVIDYAPGSPIAEDYRVLAGWLRSVAEPTALSGGRVRWMER